MIWSLRNKPVGKIPASTLTILEEYPWPGNVRELEHLVERALIISKDGRLPFSQLLGLAVPSKEQANENMVALKAVEKRHILKILKACNWKINGQGGAAEKLELTPSTLRDRMKKHGIKRPV